MYLWVAFSVVIMYHGLVLGLSVGGGSPEHSRHVGSWGYKCERSPLVILVDEFWLWVNVY